MSFRKNDTLHETSILLAVSEVLLVVFSRYVSCLNFIVSKLRETVKSAIKLSFCRYKFHYLYALAFTFDWDVGILAMLLFCVF